MSRLQDPSSAPEETGFALRTERLGPLPLINHFIERVGRKPPARLVAGGTVRVVPPDRQSPGTVLGRPVLTGMVFKDLLGGRRCDRRGFPAKVKAELFALRGLTPGERF